ncbi:putative peptidase S9, prolyl oligopeptidase, catalytic domain, six-bladed beta-propeller, TolB [Septoria linicola]|nr:putative peptidase S9, prolyl oligopeptidase, catalytic domain, six-bladed beta-propeller, TolB [Septoria linicola]
MAFSYAAVTALLLPLVECITPEQMISAPRYSAVIPNPSGVWAIYNSANYSFEDHKSSKTWWLLHLATGNITDLPWGGDVSEVVWVGASNTSVLYINGTNDEVPGGVTLYTADLAEKVTEPKMVASLAASYSGLKAIRTASGDINFLVNSLAYANNGSAYNEELAAKPAHTGMLYDSIYVRHWDTWLTQQRVAVFSGVLKSHSNSSGYTFDGTTTNLIHNLNYTATRPESPVQPFGGRGDYDISPDGSTVVFLTKAPELPKANKTASYLYLVPHDGSSAPVQLNGPGSKAPEVAQGASGAPFWSPDGKKFAYFQQDVVYYESDRSKIYVADVESKEITQVAADWDYSASSLKWDAEGKYLYVAADYIGATRLFIVPTDAAADYQPTNITDITSVNGFYVLPNGSALVSANAVWASYLLYTVTPEAETHHFYRSNEVDAELAGLGPENVDFFWYNGTLGDAQQAIIVYPTNFDPSQVYDLIFYIHGGPQGYTGNTWSTRWNLKTWADQNYVLIGPNPTGSTSYGQNLTDRIQAQWGGYPYEDLVNALSHACTHLPYINCSNAVEAGASYGGYMTNWIQGHPLGREFRALVSHDGVATTYADWSTEELWFTLHEFNGTLWDQPSRSTYESWDPLKHAKNFSTPQFVIHNEKDYRLPISEGLAMFNALQTVGVPSRFLSFPDENHWVLNKENSLFWHKEIFNWINYWTGKIDELDGNAITQ